MDWVTVILATLLGIVLAGSAYWLWRLGQRLDRPGHSPGVGRTVSILKGLLAFVVYALSVAFATGSVLVLSVSFMGVVGRISGWSAKTTASAATGLAFGAIILAIGLYVFTGLWKGYLRHLLPGSVRGTVLLQPSGSVDPELIRKRWERAEKIDPIALSIGAWIVAISLAKDWSDNSVVAVWGTVAFLGCAIAVAPRAWRGHQYGRKKSVVRVNGESLPNDDTLFEILIPRSILTPLVVALLAPSVSKLLPDPLNSAPLGSVAGLMVWFAMAFPLTMEREVDES